MEPKLKVCIDSRMVKPGEYFVPVKGESVDGHRFIDSAMKNGAAGILEESELYKLAKNKISRIKPKIVGVTGSSGKTTVTNFLYQVLSIKNKVCLGSLNTKLGLSVNVVNEMDEDCRYFIAEMGMDRAGELAETTKTFPPDIAVITTINHVHLEKLGSIEAIANAKAEILYGLKKGGVAILNGENAQIKRIGREYINKGGKVIWYTSKTQDPAVILPKHLLGSHNIRNAVCVTAVCRQLEIASDDINRGLQELKLPKGRLNVIEGLNGSTVIDDTYNANPESSKYALEVLNNYKGRRKVAVLGDMLELGRLSVKDHREVGKLVDKLNIDVLICVGSKAKDIKTAAQKCESHWIETSDDFAEVLELLKPKEGDVILVKGSQGVRMERIVKALMRYPNSAPDLLVRQDARWVASSTSLQGYSVSPKHKDFS